MMEKGREDRGARDDRQDKQDGEEREERRGIETTRRGSIAGCMGPAAMEPKPPPLRHPRRPRRRSSTSLAAQGARLVLPLFPALLPPPPTPQRRRPRREEEMEKEKEKEQEKEK